MNLQEELKKYKTENFDLLEEIGLDIACLNESAIVGSLRVKYADKNAWILINHELKKRGAPQWIFNR